MTESSNQLEMATSQDGDQDDRVGDHLNREWMTLGEQIEEGFDRLRVGVERNPKLQSIARDLVVTLDVAKKSLREIEGHEHLVPALRMSRYRQLDQVVHRAEQGILNAEYSAVLTDLSFIMELVAAMAEDLLEANRIDELDRRALKFVQQSIRHQGEVLSVAAARAYLENTAERITQIREDAEEAAGVIAGSEIASFYLEHAQMERLRYRAWNAVLVVTVLASISLTWFIVSRAGDAPLTAQEISRLALALPLLTLLVYAGRQATFHRDQESSARLTAVQLRTVRSFTDALPSSGKETVMLMLAEKVFGGVARVPAEPEDGGDSDNGGIVLDQARRFLAVRDPGALQR
ncbi:hypothetical protein OG994_12690 [Micromonospora globbae]|uniref:DUF2207 domain-containing protein n=1 Tax=Micromonospora globbae TaxID=1894969 RepID=A0ABZ1SCQ9_9ACTN|nr:hypothetical protein [Micromonospora globbae]